MRLEDSKFFNEAVRFIGYGCSMGWHERNAGNISLRLNDVEISNISDSFDYSREYVPLADAVPDMAGEYIFTTVSGSYFIDISDSSSEKFVVVNISDDGKSYKCVWGEKKPTSELCGHLMALSELKKRGSGRAVYHCHPSNTVAMTYLLPQNDKDFSNALWESETECAFVFPRGVGVVGFNIPGSIELARATAEKIRNYDAVIWSFHGVFASGDSISSAFGLAHAIEKSAEIWFKVNSSGLKLLNSITTEQQESTARYYGFELNKF